MNLSSFNSCLLKFLFDQNLTSNASQSNHSSPTLDDVIMSGLIHCRRGEDDQLRSKHLIRFYINGVAGFVVSAFGLAGNLTSFLVLTRKSMSHISTYCYLSALSVFDFFFILCSVLLHAEEATPPSEDTPSWLEPTLLSYYPHLFPYLHPIAFFIQVASIWLTLAFTVDRYIMICLPFRADSYCTVTRARKVILVLTLTCFLFNLPKFFEYRTVQVTPGPIGNFRRGRGTRHASAGEYDVIIALTPIGENVWFKILYHSWFYVVFVSGVPFVVLFVLNGLLISTVRSSRRRGKQLNPGERKRTDTTIMLISVVLLFFVCQTPALVSRVLWAYQDPSQAIRQPPYFILNEMGNFLILLNSSINILPYYFFSKRFRDEFTLWFCCGRCRHGRAGDTSDTNVKPHMSAVWGRQDRQQTTTRLPHQRSSLGSNMCYGVDSVRRDDCLVKPSWWRARPSFVCR